MSSGWGTTVFLFYLQYLFASSFPSDAELNEPTLNLQPVGRSNITYSYNESVGVLSTNYSVSTMSLGTRNEEKQKEVVEEYEEEEGTSWTAPSYIDLLAPNGSLTNGSETLDDIPWDELHIVKVRTKTPSGVRKSAGALVQDRIVLTCCRCVKLTDSEDDFNFVGRGDGDEDAIQVTRGATGETRYVDRMSFGIRRYCIDDPDTNIGVTLILTKPFLTEPMRLTLGPTLSPCRFYAFNKKKYSGPEPSILGHYDLKVLLFKPNAYICRNRTALVNRKVVCGAVIDEDHQFCGLRAGAIVICDLRLMGVSQTTCKVPYYQTSKKKTRVLSYVSIITREELRYWQKLLTLIGGDSDSSCKNKHNCLLISLLIVAVAMVYFLNENSDNYVTFANI